MVLSRFTFVVELLVVNVPELESVLDCGCFLSMSRVPLRQSIAMKLTWC